MRKRTVIIVLSAFVATLFVVGVGLFAYDTTQKDHIAKGVEVGGVDVGGLTKGAAQAKLQAALLDPLEKPVSVRVGGTTYHLTAEDAHVTANIDSLVDDAVARSRSGDPFSRAVRDITGGSLDANLNPKIGYDHHAVASLVKRISRRIDRSPSDAKVQFDASGLNVTPARDGLKVRQAWLRKKVETAVVSPSAKRKLKARTERTSPKVTTASIDQKYNTAIVIDRSAFTLKLYKDLKLFKTYDVAVGQQGLDTPAGLYNVQDKQVDPDWNVPYSSWTGDLAGKTIPGGTPENPLKARWLGIFDGAGIHGVDPSEYGSIGHAASHGCVRMRIPDVIDLYDRVPVGAPIFIA